MTNKFLQPLGMANNEQAAALLINRTFNEGRRDQYKRELTWNSVQAGAHNVLATALRLPAEYGDGGIKAAFVDDGCGMARTKIRDYYGELFNGASELGSDGNFQMGARVSTLPWNPDGVLVASWVADEEAGALLFLRWDNATRTYGVEWQHDGDTAVEVGVAPEWLHHPVIEKAGHGTVVVLLGDGGHTIGEIGLNARTGEFVYPDRRVAETDWHYYNAKYWTLPDAVTMRTMWARQNLSEWGELIGPGEFFTPINDREGQAANYRTIEGLDKRIDTRAVARGGDRGTVHITSPHGYGATVHWALFPQTGNTKADGTTTGNEVRDSGLRLGLFGERYGDEIYNVQAGHEASTSMAYYGISRKELRERIVLVVEPDAASDRFIGAYPSGARDRLLIANANLPHQHWGEAFAEQMPKAISDRLRELNGENDDAQADRHRKLLDRVREFLGRPLIRSNAGDEKADTGEQPGGEPACNNNPRGPRSKSSTGGRTGRRGFGDRPNSDGEKARPLNQRPPKDIEVTWDAPDEFTETPGLIAHYVGRTLQLNPNHGIVRALITGEQAGRRSDKHDEIASIVRSAISDHLVGTIYAAELYSRSALTGGQPFGEAFTRTALSDEMLTAACLNVATMERIVRQPFQGRTGFKRMGAVA